MRVSVRGLRCSAQLEYHAPADPHTGYAECVELSLWSPCERRRLIGIEQSLSARDWDDVVEQYRAACKRSYDDY